jgi:hypothetical protein
MTRPDRRRPQQEGNMAVETAPMTLEERDTKAESAVAGGLAAVVLMAFLPGPVSMIGWIGTVGLMTNGIADSYGHYDAKKDNLVERVVSILLAGGSGWILRIGGVALLSTLLAFTGIGYIGSIGINLAVGVPMAYAVAKGARAIYRGELTGETLTPNQVGEVVRNAYSAAQRSNMAGQVTTKPTSDEEAAERMRQAMRDAEQGDDRTDH